MKGFTYNHTVNRRQVLYSHKPEAKKASRRLFKFYVNEVHIWLVSYKSSYLGADLVRMECSLALLLILTLICVYTSVFE